MDKISLFSRHTFASCIGKGWIFLAKHLLLLAKVMLPYFTVLSLSWVTLTIFNIKLNIATIAYGMVSYKEILIQIALFTLTWAISVITLARLFLFFRRITALEIPTQEDISATKIGALKNTCKRTMQLAWRSMPYTIWVFILNILARPIFEVLIKDISELTFTNKVLAICISIIICISVVVFLTPLIYTFYCRMMKPTVIINDGQMEQAFTFKEAYKKGFHNKGKILFLTIWSVFLLVLACTIILLPGIVAIKAYLCSMEGIINFGDTAIIPASGYTLITIVGTIATTFCCFMTVAFYASLMYLFGDIYSK